MFPCPRHQLEQRSLLGLRMLLVQALEALAFLTVLQDYAVADLVATYVFPRTN